MQTVKHLIDAAIKRASTQSALARALGWSPADVSKLAAGRRPVTPEIVGVLSDYVGLTGEQARYLAALCVVEAAKNSANAEVLKRAFFLLAGLGVSASLMLQSNNATAKTLDFQARRSAFCKQNINCHAFCRALYALVRGLSLEAVRRFRADASNTLSGDESRFLAALTAAAHHSQVHNLTRV